MASRVTNNGNGSGLPSSSSSEPRVSAATKAAREALEQLNQRGEKVNNLQAKTSNMASAAAEFAANAKKLSAARGKQPTAPANPPVPAAVGSSRPSPERRAVQPSSNPPVNLPTQEAMNELMNFSASFARVKADPKILEAFRKQNQNKSVEDLKVVLGTYEKSSANKGNTEEFDGEVKILRELISQKSSTVSVALSYLNPYAYMK